MEKGFKKTACDILGITQRSYSNYSSQNRPIIKLLEKYFSKADLEEFLLTYSIGRMDTLKNIESKLKGQLVKVLELFNELFLLRRNIIDVKFVFSSIIVYGKIKISFLLELYPQYADLIDEEVFQNIVSILEEHINQPRYEETINYISNQHDLKVLIEYAGYQLELNNRVDLFNIAILIFIIQKISEKSFDEEEGELDIINKIFNEQNISEFTKGNIDIFQFNINKIDQINKSFVN